MLMEESARHHEACLEAARKAARQAALAIAASEARKQARQAREAARRRQEKEAEEDDGSEEDDDSVWLTAQVRSRSPFRRRSRSPSRRCSSPLIRSRSPLRPCSPLDPDLFNSYHSPSLISRGSSSPEALRAPLFYEGFPPLPSAEILPPPPCPETLSPPPSPETLPPPPDPEASSPATCTPPSIKPPSPSSSLTLPDTSNFSPEPKEFSYIFCSTRDNGYFVCFLAAMREYVENTNRDFMYAIDVMREEFEDSFIQQTEVGNAHGFDSQGSSLVF